MITDASEIKQKILYFIKMNGPSLPVRISREIKSDTLFTSAFLSELFNEKVIKMSDMRIGSSPLYFIEGHEFMLENFSHYLKSKEKEAFGLLKEKSFLKDSEQNPAIRVALREIKDFAIPFKRENGVIWRYFLIPESEFKKGQTEVKEEEKPEKEIIEVEKPLEIPKRARGKRKTAKKKSEEKEKFFDIVKQFISKNSIELKDIEGFTKNEIILRVLDKGEEKILLACNKRKISDNDIIKAHKKLSKKGLPYMLLGLSEPSKKTSELIKAIKDLHSIQGIK